MTFNEMYNALDNVIRDVKSNKMGNAMVQIGVAAITMIRQRIITTGENAKGGKFPPYSTKGMLSGCKNFIQKDSCENYIKTDPKWVMVDRGMPNMRPLFVIPGGYKQFRELNQRQSAFVDFSFTNRMWMNIKLVSSNTEHNNGLVIIGATTPLDKAKLAGNTERKGTILELSKKEIKELSGYYNLKLKQFFQEAGV